MFVLKDEKLKVGLLFFMYLKEKEKQTDAEFLDVFNKLSNTFETFHTLSKR